MSNTDQNWSAVKEILQFLFLDIVSMNLFPFLNDEVASMQYGNMQHNRLYL